MTWHLAVRRWRLTTTLLAASLVLMTFVGTSVVPIPSLGQAASWGVPAALVLPALQAAVIASALGGGTHLDAQRGSSVRRTVVMDRWYVLALVIAVVVVESAVGLVGDDPLLASAARNLLAGVGVALLAARVAGPQVAPVAPVLVTLFCGVFGRGLAGPEPWAWLLHEPFAPGALALSVVLFAAGLVRLR